MPAKRAALTDEEISRIVSIYESGGTVRALARQFGIRTDAVTNVLTSRGVEIRSGRAKLTPDEELVLVHRHLSGETSASLGRVFGITPGTVTRILGRHGVAVSTGRPSGKGWSDEMRGKMVTLYESGLSQQKIADEVGVSQAVVSRVLRREGVFGQEWDRPSRESHGRWQGGRVINSQGYVLVMPSQEDLAYCTPSTRPYVAEHRLVLGRKLGRPLTSTETVHHIDGDRQNNHPDNLQLRQGKHGNGVAYSCRDCGSHNVEPRELA